MKGIAFAAAAIGIGVTAGLAAPYLAGKVQSEFAEITQPAAVAQRADAPTSDPGGLVGAAEVQPSLKPSKKPANPAAAPAPAKAVPAAEMPRVPTRIVREAALRKMDCRKYVPKAQVTISVPCDGKDTEDTSESKDDDKKETKKSRKEKKAASATSDEEATIKPGICRQYVTRAGLTQLQTVPCNSPRTAQAATR